MAENSATLMIGILAVVLLTAGLTYIMAKEGALAPPAGNDTGGGSEPTITVRGEAARTLSPDLLTLGLAITTSGNDTLSSQSANAAETAKAKAALLAAGLDASQIETTSYYTYPEYNGSCYGGYYPYYDYSGPYYSEGSEPAVAEAVPYPAEGDAERCLGPDGEPIIGPNGTVYRCGNDENGSVEGGAPPEGVSMDIAPYPPPYHKECKIIGYKTTHSLALKANDTSKGGAYVEAALNATAFAKVEYVYFSIREDTRLEAEAGLQAEAARAAKSKAEGIAQGLGARLGKVVAVNPEWNYPYPVYAYDARGMAEPDAAAAPTEIFPGETTMYGYITVEYELLQ